MFSADPLDVAHSQLVVVWGANPTVSNIHFPPIVTKAQREHGATLVVVDPRRTAMAARADLHLAVRPGTDVVLAYAVAHELERQGLLDDRVPRRARHGRRRVPRRGARVPGARSPPRSAACRRPTSSGWPRSSAPSGPVSSDSAGGRSATATAARRASRCWRCPVLAGQFGVPGSGVIASLSNATPLAWDAREPDTPPERRHPRAFGMNRFGAALCDPTLDPPIDVLFVQGSNLAATNPDQQAVLRGLAREDLFTVVHDQVLTDTARYADVVLPATTHFETHDLAASYGAYVLQETRPVIEPVGESRSNNEVAAELARRLGYDLTRFDVDRAAILERVASATTAATTVPAPTRPRRRDRAVPRHRAVARRRPRPPGVDAEPRRAPLRRARRSRTRSRSSPPRPARPSTRCSASSSRPTPPCTCTPTTPPPDG